ncbi:MAG: hypothetical protein VW683_17190 [Betaproteobacteria bacterium]
MARDREKHKAYMKKWHAKNKEAQIAYRKQWREDNPDYQKEHYAKEENRAKKRDWEREYYAKNREKMVKKSSDWAKANRDKVNESQRVNKRMYMAKRRAATPAWNDELVMRMIYEDCPQGHHVDHIIPLNGKNVSGLHVHYNLQWLPAEENIRKSNQWH